MCIRIVGSRPGSACVGSGEEEELLEEGGDGDGVVPRAGDQASGEEEGRGGQVGEDERQEFGDGEGSGEGGRLGG